MQELGNMTARVERSELVGCRTDLARLANQKNLKVAVEVGTDRGEFACEFLRWWTGEMLFCVDPWLPYDDMLWDRTGDMHHAIQSLIQRGFGHRFRIVRATSVQAAAYLTEYVRGVDLVYLDGAHDYENVKTDIAAWWPLVRPGGVLAGDDYDTVEHPGVIQAVNEFAEEGGHVVRLTTDYNRFPSWYIEKPEPIEDVREALLDQVWPG